MNTATRINLSMTIRSFGRRWWTRVSTGYSHNDRFHWTARSAKARHLTSGGELLRRRGINWGVDWEHERSPQVAARKAVRDREFRALLEKMNGGPSSMPGPGDPRP